MATIVANGTTFDTDTWAGGGYLNPYTGFLACLAAVAQDASRTPIDVSATTNDVGTGAKTFALSGKRPFAVGAWVVAAQTSAPANFMYGRITAYNQTTGAMTVNVTTTGGSGAGITDWSLSVSGPAGPADSTAIKQGLHTIWLPAGAMTARTTSGPSSGSVETNTNKVMLKTLDFDAGTVEYAQAVVRMPKSWNRGTITAAFVWKHAATTTNFKVSWGIQAVALSDDDAADAAFGTAIYANDTGGTTNDIYVSAATAAVTIAGTPAAEDLVCLQFLRKADDATNDTLAVDAGLLGVTIYYTVNAATDA